ncbi:MAG: hypothetical protein OEU60_05835 [Gammaproteobacteria bacterium]|jgi:hypothetical protein|nr:hypothetical protein [Gammaproteobacteria bacterium]
MTTLTGRQVRTISGYVATLLDYPRWFIDREVDFTDCHLKGRFEPDDRCCADCRFGSACRWLNQNRLEPTPDTPLTDLVNALQTAVSYVRGECPDTADHARDCDCDTCEWLHEASAILRTHRHKT